MSESISRGHENDLISRQAAIDATWRETGYTDPINVATAIRGRIEALPSTQPELIRCKDCKHWRSNTEFCSTFTELNVAHRMPPNGFCSCAERRDE